MNKENGVWAFIEHLKIFRDNYLKMVATRDDFLSQRE